MSRWHPERLPDEVRQMASAAAHAAGVSLPLWLSRAIRDASAAESAAGAPRPIPPAAQKILALLKGTVAHGDLPTLEEARSYRRLATEFGLSAEEISQSVGRPHEHVARQLRLSALPENVVQLIERRALSVEHAYALLEAKDPASLGQAVQALGRAVQSTRANERGV